MLIGLAIGWFLKIAKATKDGWMLLQNLTYLSLLLSSSFTQGFLVPGGPYQSPTELAARVGIVDTPISFAGDLKEKANESRECNYDPIEKVLSCNVLYGRNFQNPYKQSEPDFINEKTSEVIKYLKIKNKKRDQGFINIFEQKWLNSKSKDPEFSKEYSLFTENSHGTHVAGIAAKEISDISIFELVFISFKNKIDGRKSFLEHSKEKSQFLDRQQFAELEQFLEKYIDQLIRKYQDMATFIGFHAIDIVNGSYGTPPFKQLILRTCYKKNLFPPSVQVDYLEQKYLEKYKRQAKKALENDSTLYIFAAGNDQINCDLHQSMPSCLNSDQILTVASVNEKGELSEFSNWGERSVDIAAPGEKVWSSVPGDVSMQMSGTSQAAPQVTNVATLLKNAKEDLKPQENKYILMNTVDHYDALEGKVKSAGVLNKERASVAVSYFQEGFSIEDACKKSYEDRPE